MPLLLYMHWPTLCLAVALQCQARDPHQPMKRDLLDGVTTVGVGLRGNTHETETCTTFMKHLRLFVTSLGRQCMRHQLEDARFRHL